jgi:hypothetical protein
MYCSSNSTCVCVVMRGFFPQPSQCDVNRAFSAGAFGTDGVLGNARRYSAQRALIWGAHAPRVLAMAPSPSRTFLLRTLRRGRRNEHARARALPGFALPLSEGMRVQVLFESTQQKQTPNAQRRTSNVQLAECPIRCWMLDVRRSMFAVIGLTRRALLTPGWKPIGRTDFKVCVPIAH